MTVIEMAVRMGQDIGPSTRWVLLKELRARGVELITGATLKDISSTQVVYTDSQGAEVTLPADTVVLALGTRPENSLGAALEKAGVRVQVIGDAAKVGLVGEAVDAGFELARKI